MKHLCRFIKDKATSRKRRMQFSAFFLFFSFFVVWFILVSTDTEYNLNQQIARGYITRNAVFFELHDPTRVDAVAFSITSENIDLYSDSNGVIELDLSVGEAENRDYIFSNEVLSNGLTKVENIFNSLDGNYLVAIHDGELRGVLFRGDVTCPPVIEGRFFEEYECLSRDNLAVVGSDFLDDVYFKNNERFIQYNDKEYKVIGIVGIATSSTLDSMIFVNIGSLSPEKQLNKRYYIDGNNSMETIYSEMNENSLDLFGLELDRLDMPITLIDSASGGMYLKSYIVLFLVSLSFCLYGCAEDNMNESSLVSEYDNVDNIDQMISTTSTYEDVNTHDNTLLYDDVLDSGLCFIERTENTSLGTERFLFIREEDGKVIADFGRATNVSNDNGYFFVDINGDGIGELICNSQSADGAERVIIFRNNNGTIQYGLISEEIVLEMFDFVQIDYPGALQEKYDDSNGIITLTLYNSDSEQYEEILLEFERLEVFEFYDYEYIE